MAIVLSLIFLSLGIGVLVLIHICTIGRAIRQDLTNNNVAANIMDRGSLGSTSMSQEDIEKLPCFDFMEKEIKGNNSPCPNCAVCLENFAAGEKCRLLPLCNHSFHAECVDLWLLRAPICPICRANADMVRTDSLPDEEGRVVEFTDVPMGGEVRVENEGVIRVESGNISGSSNECPFEDQMNGSSNLTSTVVEVEVEVRLEKNCNQAA